MSIARPFPSSRLLSKGLPLPLLPPSHSTRPVGAGPPWVLSLEAGFVSEVHLQGWENLLKTGERPGLGVRRTQGRRYLEKPLQRNSSQMCSFQVPRFGALPHFPQSYCFAGSEEHCLCCLPACSPPPLPRPRMPAGGLASSPQPASPALALVFLSLLHAPTEDAVSERTPRGGGNEKDFPFSRNFPPPRPVNKQKHAPLSRGVQALER